MIDQLAKLIQSGKLSAVNLKVTVQNGQPVVQMSAMTDGADVSLIGAHSEKDAEAAREEITAIRANLARPVVFTGEDISEQIQQAIPVLSGSLNQATETLDALSMAAKLDGASAKGKATADKSAEKAASTKAKSEKTKSKTAGTASKKASSDAADDAKKDASNATGDTVEASQDSAEQNSTSAASVTDQFNFKSL